MSLRQFATTCCAERKISQALGLFCGVVCLFLGSRAEVRGDETWIWQDVGSVGLPGVSSYDGSTDTFTLQGSGAGVSGTADGFHFDYFPVSGNIEIIARIASQTNTSNYAQAGLMIRSSLSATSSHALIAVSPANGVNFSWRAVSGQAGNTTLGPAIKAPTWVRLVRSGSTLAGYQSSDGVAWTLVGQISASLDDVAYAGFAVSSHDDESLSTAVFDHVTVLTNVPQRNPLLKLWLRADVNVSLDGMGKVMRWEDQSGNGNDVFQNTISSQPTYQTAAFYGQPVLHFNGSSQFLTGLATANLKASNVTLMAVYRLTAHGNSPKIIALPYFSSGWTSPFTAWDLSADTSTNGKPAVGMTIGANHFENSTMLTALNTPYLLIGTFDGNMRYIFLNGLLMGSGLNPGSISYGSATSFNIGGDPVGDFLNGDIAEILVYNQGLSDDDRHALEAYFFQKYGVGNQPAVAAPSLSIQTGTYSDNQLMALNAPAGSVLYYTTDGSTPTNNSTRYTSPITISTTTTFKAVATRLGYGNSPVTTAIITIDNATTGVVRQGLQLWLKADALATANGAGIGQWADQSGNGNDVTQTNTGNQP
ncbi:MAG: chitobiase/beta-hexosaminidase C-terminal domain-containing protein, partial [Verrucomicrobia bacterium]|nr:chitobiase/beta-hexosaminidase C-terminal domain-containing protein [Verrucomicrobiota bacterium]